MPFGRYNLRPRVAVSYITPRSLRKTSTNKNPHLDIKVGDKRIYFRKAATTTTVEPGEGPFTKAAAYEHISCKGAFMKKKEEREGRGHRGERGKWLERKEKMEKRGGSGLRVAKGS